MPRKSATIEITTTSNETETWDGEKWVTHEPEPVDADDFRFVMEPYENPDHDALAAAMAQDASEEPDDSDDLPEPDGYIETYPEQPDDDVADAIAEAVASDGEPILRNPEFPNTPARTAHVDDYQLVSFNKDAYDMPNPEIFIEEDGSKLDFYHSWSLDAMIRDVIEKYDGKFAKLADLDIQGWWQKKGRIAGGRLEFARTTKPTGLIRQLTQADVVIYFAYDHIGGANLTQEQMENTIAHELCHISLGNKKKVTIMDHDFEGFAWEYATLGPWRKSLETVTKIANEHQFNLPLFEDPASGD